MKKLTLTFCAMFALFVVAAALYADGPENYSGKEKQVMQPAPPVCDIYRAHEWDLDIWGAYAFAANTGQRHDTRTPEEADPFTPDDDIGNFDYGTGVFTENLAANPRERINLGRVSNNELFGRDNTWGGGVDVKYFWSKYFGAGIEAVGLAAKTNFAGGGLLTLTGRYPFGRFAPYITGGIGFITGGAATYEFFNEIPDRTHDSREEFLTTDPVSNHTVRALGQIGVGLEYRLTCHVGLMTDFTWNFIFGHDAPDKFPPVTEQGTSTFSYFGDPVGSTVVINRAKNFRPGLGSDNQDFGMVRVGVTFSY